MGFVTAVTQRKDNRLTKEHSMAATFEPSPMRRAQTESERHVIDSVETSLRERISILRDTRSADGIQESVLDRYRKINPPARGTL